MLADIGRPIHDPFRQSGHASSLGASWGTSPPVMNSITRSDRPADDLVLRSKFLNSGKCMLVCANWGS